MRVLSTYGKNGALMFLSALGDLCEKIIVKMEMHGAIFLSIERIQKPIDKEKMGLQDGAIVIKSSLFLLSFGMEKIPF